MGEHFPVREFWGDWKSQNFKDFYTKLGKFAQFFPVIWILNNFYFCLWIWILLYLKIEHKYWKMETYTGKVREICQSDDVGTMVKVGTHMGTD